MNTLILLTSALLYSSPPAIENPPLGAVSLEDSLQEESSEKPLNITFSIPWGDEDPEGIQEVLAAARKFWERYDVPIEFTPGEGIDFAELKKYSLSKAHLIITNSPGIYSSTFCSLEEFVQCHTTDSCPLPKSSNRFMACVFASYVLKGNPIGRIIPGIPVMAVYFPPEEEYMNIPKKARLVAHEIGHLLGLWHPQNICQRDEEQSLVPTDEAVLNLMADPFIAQAVTEKHPLGCDLTKEQASIARDMLFSRGKYARLFTASGYNFTTYLQLVAEDQQKIRCK